MPSRPQLPLLVVLLGPTASGKTALSLTLAEHFAPAEILSCDSIALYRGMDLGSAKPSLAERARAPHHLIDVADPDQPCTAGDYSRLARARLAEITARNHLPIITGGTGLYLRALLDGLFPGPQRSNSLRSRLQASAQRADSRAATSARDPLTETGPSPNPVPRQVQPPATTWLHRLLARLDPPSAARIHPNDQPKLIRALEVRLTSRQPLSSALSGDQARDPLTGYRILRLGLAPDRAALYARIDSRAASMFASGLVDETRTLLARYQPPPLALSALGYRQAAQYLAGTLTLPEAIAEARQGHRNYAKRQLTWFRREPNVHWLPGFGDHPSIAAQAIDLVTAHLAG